MKLSVADLNLSFEDVIDLQLHTEFSDGKWTAEALIDHLKSEGFGLAAITDHDRADMVAHLQKIAIEKHFPLLVAVEVSSMWKENLVDFLCYGFAPDNNDLLALSHEVAKRQSDNTTLIIESLRQDNYPISDEELATILAKPSSQHMMSLVELVTKHKKGNESIGQTLMNAGFEYITISPDKIVTAAHESGAICILAHPGRDDGFTCFDESLLDELRIEAPIDGIEAYYPKHSPEQTEMYLAYAQKHDLLISAGSDSHSDENPPIKYKVSLVQKMLKQLHIKIG